MQTRTGKFGFTYLYSTLAGLQMSAPGATTSQSSLSRMGRMGCCNDMGEQRDHVTWAESCTDAMGVPRRWLNPVRALLKLLA
jgi:hypothetical protein